MAFSRQSMTERTTNGSIHEVRCAWNYRAAPSAVDHTETILIEVHEAVKFQFCGARTLADPVTHFYDFVVDDLKKGTTIGVIRKYEGTRHSKEGSVLRSH